MDPELDIIRSRTLFRAVHLAGNVETLAKHLDVTQKMLLRWLAGCDPAPERAFLKCVDLLLAVEATNGSPLQTSPG